MSDSKQNMEYIQKLSNSFLDLWKDQWSLLMTDPKMAEHCINMLKLYGQGGLNYHPLTLWQAGFKAMWSGTEDVASSTQQDTDVPKVLQRLTEMEEQIVHIQKQQENRTLESTTLENLLSTHQQVLEKLKEQRDTLSTQIENLAKQVGQLTEKVTTTDKSLEEIREKLTNFSTLVSKHIKRLEEQVANITEQQVQLKEQQDANTPGAKTLDSSSLISHESFTELRNRIETLEQQLVSVETRNSLPRTRPHKKNPGSSSTVS